MTASKQAQRSKTSSSSPSASAKRLARSKSVKDKTPSSTVPQSPESAPPLPPTRRFVYTRPPLYAKQETAIFNPIDLNGDPARYSIIEASTKAGKTVGCIAWLFEEAYKGTKGQAYWWIAPVYNQAKIAFTRSVEAIPPEFIRHVHNGDLVIYLINGTAIYYKSGEKPDGLYGEDVYAAVIDEASRLREESWHAVRSTLTATRGPVRLIGNVKGRKNFFYALARKAESGAAGMSFHRIVASDAVDAGVLDASEIEDARRVLPDHAFRELYLAQASDDGGNPFGLDSIAKCIWPLSETEPRVWGWDLAKSTDWTVGTALDDHGRVCRFERWQHIPWSETVNRILKFTGDTQALVDSTGVGDPIVEALQAKKPQTFEGYNFSSSSKQKLMEGLAMAVQSREVTILDGVMRSEMELFEYEYTRTGVRYSAPDGYDYHDDCVCSLALANHHRSRATVSMVISGAAITAARAFRFTPRAGRLG